ncbi:MAG: hypothetical protein KAW19_08585, partial [Candidatus Aminicenantes bacterium]|nr:hypothetical protein [Candidatus Aminicenantes bacterium]
ASLARQARHIIGLFRLFSLVRYVRLDRLSGLSPPVIASDQRERGNPIQRRYKMRLLRFARNHRRLVNGK